MGGPVRVRFTGSIHDEEGLLTMDRGKIERKLTHLCAKITARPEWVELSSEDVDDSAETLVISYGVADGAAREAVRMSRSGGRSVSHLTLYTLWPVAVGAIRRAMTPRVRRVIVPELNIGLYVDELRRHLPGVEVESMTRYDGRLIHPSTIADRIGERAAATFGGRPCPC
jgi:pyruvate/2-oxoacid:ferredoxin oxidoreductase alpha subunit